MSGCPACSVYIYTNNIFQCVCVLACVRIQCVPTHVCVYTHIIV